MKLSAPQGASPDQLKANFRELAKLCHPDTCPDKNWATREFQELTADLKYRLAFKVEVVKPKEKPKPPPPKPPQKTITITVAFGFSARMRGETALIDLYVPKGASKVMVVLLPGQLGERMPEYMLVRTMYRFGLEVPPFENGSKLNIANLEFPCQITLYHKP